MRHRAAFAFAVLAVGAAAAVSSSCTFPDFDVTTAGNTGSDATSTTGTAGGGGQAAQGSSSASAGGQGGMGGMPPGCEMGGFGGQSLCDGDGDRFWKKEAPCCAVDFDCNDDNVDVHSTQSAYFDVPIPGTPPPTDYDYDCDGQEEPDPVQMINGNGSLDCGNLMNCATSKEGFGPQSTCGSTDQYFQCSLTAVCSAVPVASKQGKLRCH